MNKVKKIKNLFVTSFVLFFLTDRGYKLYNGLENANRVCDNHINSINHLENVVAHRGFSSLYPDNSIEGINAALDSCCVDMIEIDVRKTLNNKIVLYHDSMVTIEDIAIQIENLNLEEIDSEDGKYIIKNYPSYNFEELMYDDQLFLYKRFLHKEVDLEEKILVFLTDIIRNYSFTKPLIIDVKTNNEDISFINELNRILNNYKDLIYIQSNCFEFLNKMIELYPDYKYLYIINSFKNLKNKNNNFTGYTVRYGLLNKINIEDDKLYLIYTINSNLKYYNLLNNKNYRDNMYIITDNPDYICALGENKILRK